MLFPSGKHSFSLMLIHVLSPSELKPEVGLCRTACKPETNFADSFITISGVAKIYFTGIGPLVVVLRRSKGDTFSINIECAALSNIVIS